MENNWLQEKDDRQINRMNWQIQNYEDQRLDLGGLIGDLDFLLGAIERKDDGWKQQINEQILLMEAIYAYRLDREEHLTEDDKLEVNRAIGRIKKLLSHVKVDES